MHSRFNVLIFAAALIALMALGTGCEEFDSGGTPDFGQVRVKNETSNPVDLFLNGEHRTDIRPGKRRVVRVGDGLQQISIQNGFGEVLFEQSATIPDNTFADYTVHEDESVIATAGNIDRPDIVGSSRRQIRLENTANFPVRMLIDGVFVVTVENARGVAVDAPDEAVTVSFRKNGGDLLFEQTLHVPRNTTINYAVLEDGMVITTGGPIAPNLDYVQVYW